MQELSPEARQRVEALGRRHGFSGETAASLARALLAGHGTMAQFSHPELGGQGQWVEGGMIMIGDMLNHALKARVDAFCAELAAVVKGELAAGARAGSRSSGAWWPEGLGVPASTGSQGGVRYAYFPDARRLVVESDGRATIYDTGEHRIGGVAQQQGGVGSLAFTSQHGPVRLESLREVSVEDAGSAARTEPPPASPDDAFRKIERLGELRRKGLLSEEEFASKKAELLQRI